LNNVIVANSEGDPTASGANFANTEGNVNISAILVQAKRDLVGGFCIPSKNTYTHSTQNGSQV